ncbi:hypothetical protein IW261DRAFT_1491304 [Armillaria novae-zelandiae]|uniref:F-box domain-containing protein n=1 Tax=Armillaria novae-zelandiae TaxID=153914 RepID=A0AA39P2P8_9AGAR|nr:hypothetical protein IW261DRAFT_1491304 [Armillaria novae-zelandiae]
MIIDADVISDLNHSYHSCRATISLTFDADISDSPSIYTASNTVHLVTYPVKLLTFLYAMEQPYTDAYEFQIYTYLRSNYIPTDEEGARVLSDVTFLTRELTNTNCLDREKKKTALDIRQSLTVPIRRLPVEIFLEIFSLLPPEQPPSVRQSSYTLPSRPFNTLEMPWVLSHVSSFWRSTVLTSPSLWTHIYIASNYVKHGQFLVHTALTRSQDYPLHLCIHMDSDDSECEEIVMGILSLAAPRCISLRLDIPAPILIRLSCLFPLLQQLELHVEMFPVGLSTSVAVFMQSTQLQSVRFMEIRVPDQIELPFAALRDLSQVFVDSHDELAAILKGANDLTSLEAWPSGVYSSNSPFGFPAEKITHNKLAYLDTGFSTLEHLTLPALEELILDEDDPDVDSEIIEEKTLVLPYFLDRSKCRLRRLGLMGYGRVAKILPLIFCSPSLMTLTQLEICAESVVVYGLLGDTRVMPHLRELSIRDGFETEDGETSFFGECEEAFRAMVAARRDRLIRLTLTSLEVKMLSPDLVERITQITEDGIDVTFLGPGLYPLYPS